MALPRLPFMGIDPHLPSKVKYKRLKAALGNPSDRDLCGSLYMLWSAVFTNRPDGNISVWSDDDINIVACWDKEVSLAAALRKYKWINANNTIHDWYEWGGFLYAQRKRATERVTRSRDQPKPADEPVDNDVIHVDDVLDDATVTLQAHDDAAVTLQKRTLPLRNNQPTNQPTEPTEPNRTEPNVALPRKRAKGVTEATKTETEEGEGEAAGGDGGRRGGPAVIIFEDEGRKAGVVVAITRPDAVQLNAALKTCKDEEKYRAVCAAWFASGDEFVAEKWGYAGRYLPQKLQALLNGGSGKPRTTRYSVPLTGYNGFVPTTKEEIAAIEEARRRVDEERSGAGAR